MTHKSNTGDQIPLALNLRESPGFDLIIVGENVEAIHQARRIARGINRTNLYLWGQNGSGISHLLQACCLQSDENKERVAYIPLADSSVLDPRVLENLEKMDLVCIDDIDSIAGQQDWEQSLLHLYNRLREAGTRLIIGAHSSPQTISLQLPDLKSRMSWDLVYHIKPLSDADKQEALQRRATVRGFTLPGEVADFVVTRTPRDMPSLINLLGELEQATLVHKRKLTVPFVKSFLEQKKQV